MIKIDEKLENADWLKQTWDLPNNKKDLERLIRSMGMTVDDFKKLPVYKKNVDKMDWLKEL